MRDDENGIGFLMVILAAVVGAFSAWFRPAGMGRTMVGVAVMHALLGVAIATAPSTASVPGAPFRILVTCGIFAVLWLIAAGLFRAAASAERRRLKPSDPSAHTAA